MAETTRVLRLLTGHFFRRFFDNDTIQVDADTQTTVVRALSIVAVPGLMLAFFLQNAYPQRPFWFRIEDHYTFVLITYLVMGVVTILEWEMLFPDRLDFLVLTPLPVRPREMLGGKLAALAGFVGMFLLGSSVFGAIVLPMVSKEPFLQQVWAHLVSVLLAGVFSAAWFVAIAGVVLCVMGSSRFRAVSPAIQALATMALCVLVMHFLLYGASLPVLLTPPLHAARWMPPLWFLGMYERVQHGAAAPDFGFALSRLGLCGAAVAVLVACVTYPVAWIRMRRYATEGATRARRAPSRRWEPLLGRLLRRPGERAVFHFIGQTIGRNSRYQVYLALYCGAALALAAGCGMVLKIAPDRVHAELSRHGLHAVLPLLLFWTIAGLRVAFGFPLNLDAGWIFRVTGVDLAECSAAARKWALACAAAIMLAVLVVLALCGWRGTALLVQAVCGTALAVVLTDLFFGSEASVPFNRPRLPGRVSFPLMLTLYVGVLPTLLEGMVRFEIRLEGSPLRLFFVALVADAVHLGLVRLRERNAVIEVENDSSFDGDVQLLGLS